MQILARELRTKLLGGVMDEARPQLLRRWYDGQQEALTGHCKAIGHCFGKIMWKILYTNLDLKGGVQGPGGLPLYPPFKRQMFV